MAGQGSLFRSFCKDGAVKTWWSLSGMPLGELSPAGLVDPRRVVPSPGGGTMLSFDYDDRLRTTLMPIAGGDEDFPETHARLQTWALTGTYFDSQEGVPKPYPWKELEKIRADYFKLLAEHAKHCQYPQFNLWTRVFEETEG